MMNKKPGIKAELQLTNDERRDRGRINCDQLHCDLGDVLNLSAQGMLVQHRKPIDIGMGTCLQITLSSEDTRVNLNARVCWIDRVGFRKRVLGLEFVDLTERARSVLPRLAIAASVNPVVPPAPFSFPRGIVKRGPIRRGS